MPFSFEIDSELKWVAIYRVTGQPSTEGDNAEVRAGLLRATGVMEQARTPFICVMDLREFVGMAAGQRRLLAQWRRENEVLQRRKVLGILYLARSSVVRGIITAMDWVGPAAVPTRTSEDFAGAMAWCRELLVASGKPPDEVATCVSYANQACGGAPEL